MPCERPAQSRARLCCGSRPSAPSGRLRFRGLRRGERAEIELPRLRLLQGVDILKALAGAQLREGLLGLVFRHLLRHLGEVLSALHLRSRLIDLLARRFLLFAARVRRHGDGDGADLHRGGLRPPSRFFLLVSLGDLVAVRFRELLRLRIARAHLVAEHERIETHPGDRGALVLRRISRLHLVIGDVRAGDRGLDHLAAQEVAAIGLLEALDAHSVAVLDEALVVVEVELAVLLELRAAGDGVGHLGVAHADAEVVCLLGDQLLIDEALQRLDLEIVLPGVVGRVLAAPHRRHLPEPAGVRLGEIAGRHQLAVHPRRPGLRGAGAEARGPPAEGEDEGEDDGAEDQRDQRGLGIRPHYVEHRTTTPSSGRWRGVKSPSARLLGKLDTLENPGDRCKGKSPGRDRRLPRVVSLRALDFQALSRAYLRDRPAGGPVRHLFRQGEAGARPERDRSGGDLRHRAGGEGHHPERIRGHRRLARLCRATQRARGERRAAPGQPQVPPARAAGGRAEARERPAATSARLRGQAGARPPDARPGGRCRRLSAFAHASDRARFRRRGDERHARDRAGGSGWHRLPAHRQLLRRPAHPQPAERDPGGVAADAQPQHGEGHGRHLPVQADLRAAHRRPAGGRRPGHRRRPGILPARAPRGPGGERGEEASWAVPRRRGDPGGGLLAPRRGGGGDRGRPAGAGSRGGRAGSRERTVTLRTALVLLVAIALTILESVIPHLLHLRAARPDLLLIVVLYLALRDDVIQGAALSAAAGYLSDLTSATPAFLYTFLAVLTFVVVRTAGAALRTEGGIQSAAVAFGASLGHSLRSEEHTSE